MALVVALAGCAAHPLINYASVDQPPTRRAALPPPRPLVAPPPPAPMPRATDPRALEGDAPYVAPLAATPPAIGVAVAQPLPPGSSSITQEALPETSAPPAGAGTAASAAPQPPPVQAASRSAALLRSNPWISRFWSGLSTAQRERVSRRMRNESDPAAAWDRMGLGDRLRLVYGEGA